ncbi:hypothetical protein CEUSTIGMA_g11561.t1 [Chlamydomonas eustigma]|uniref:Uncharacterized protein n=1 Tax=Chlamydomonas eustigma TaxID=1157962 RepID=A0A250XM40_9CHLO|nr:hypothetical protein CEUSTIGMA_g11561.t1 [Chlamydomonas eustigma]|eukprot:GAX84138.1 hypothetical protein CEUSTIGMA_g11561.t1 [Chlamydomonas eustigma]
MQVNREKELAHVDSEAVLLFNDLQEIVNFLGMIYAEVSGQCAATAKIVYDLRRSLSFLDLQQRGLQSKSISNYSQRSVHVDGQTDNVGHASLTCTPEALPNSAHTPGISQIARQVSVEKTVRRSSPTICTASSDSAVRPNNKITNGVAKNVSPPLGVLSGQRPVPSPPLSNRTRSTSPTPYEAHSTSSRASNSNFQSAAKRVTASATVTASGSGASRYSSAVRGGRTVSALLPTASLQPTIRLPPSTPMTPSVMSARLKQESCTNDPDLLNPHSPLNPPVIQLHDIQKHSRASSTTHDHEEHEESSIGPVPSASVQMPPRWNKVVRLYKDAVQQALKQVSTRNRSGLGQRATGPVTSSYPLLTRQETGTSSTYVDAVHVAQADARGSPQGLPGSDSYSRLVPSSTHSAITLGLTDSATSGGARYITKLHTFCAASQASGRPGSIVEGRSSRIITGSSSSSSAHGQGVVEDPQRLFAAVVAAQTWILNALRQLAATQQPGSSRQHSSSSSSSSLEHQQSSTFEDLGISAEGLYSLLQDLRVARLRLAELMDNAKTEAITAFAASPSSLGGSARVISDNEVASGAPLTRSTSSGVRDMADVARVMSGSADDAACSMSGSADDATCSMTTCSERDKREAVEAAVRWRNRFLRALVIAHKKLGQMQHDGGDSREGTGIKQQKQLMPRPVGLWLPESLWLPALKIAGQETPTSLMQGGLPWLTTLFPHLLHGPLTHKSLEEKTIDKGMLIKAPDEASQLKAKIKLNRAQQQLQHCLMQLHLEQVLASKLLPNKAVNVLPQHRLRSGGSSGPGLEGNEHLQWEQRQNTNQVDRHLARCRLAHMFISKGSWNKQYCIVESIESSQ